MFLANNDVPLRRLRSVSRAVRSDRAAKSHQECSPFTICDIAESDPPDTVPNDGTEIESNIVPSTAPLDEIQVLELLSPSPNVTDLQTVAETESGENWPEKEESAVVDVDQLKASAEAENTEAPLKKKWRRSRAGGAKVTCNICHRQYDAEYIKVHVRIHTGERPFTCAAGCQLTFATRNQHRIHFQRHHGDAQSLECDVCHRRLASKASLKEHKRTHSDEKPYACQQCDKSFKQLSLLSQHLKSHHSDQPFKCPLCPNRSYKSKRSMQRHHEAIHDGVRPSIQCEVCGKVFSDSTAFRDHSFAHRGERPYSCSYCGRKFLSKKVMNLHVLIHENKKPYQCEICGLFFRQRCVLKRHLSVHSGIKSHTSVKRAGAASSSLLTKRHKKVPKAPATVTKDSCAVDEHCLITPASSPRQSSASIDRLKDIDPNENQCQCSPLRELDTFESGRQLDRRDELQHSMSCKKETLQRHLVNDSLKELDMDIRSYSPEMIATVASQQELTHRRLPLSDHLNRHMFRVFGAQDYDHSPLDASVGFTGSPFVGEVGKHFGEKSLPPSEHERIVNAKQLAAGDVCADSSVNDRSMVDSTSFEDYPSVMGIRCLPLEMEDVSSIVNDQTAVYSDSRLQVQRSEESIPADFDSRTSFEELSEHGKMIELLPICKKSSVASPSLEQIDRNVLRTQSTLEEEFKVPEEVDDGRFGFSSDSEDVIPTLSRPPLEEEDDDRMIPEPDVMVDTKGDCPAAEPKKKPRGRKSTASRWLFRRVTTLAQCKSKLQKKLLNSKICQTRESGEEQDRGETTMAGRRQAGVLGLYRSNAVGRNGVSTDVCHTTAAVATAATTKKRAKRPFRKVTCHVCHKEYDSDYMKVHARIHTGERPFTCAAGCPMTFATCSQHRVHHQRHHGKVSELECDVCHRVLASKASLKEHKRTHSDERPYACQQCDKSFKQLSLLSQHLKSHRTEQPFQCEQCGSRYKTKRGMERHSRAVHEGLRPEHPCQLCDKVFGDSTALKVHMHRHRGETPHVCSFCERKFTSRKVLNLHLLIHEHKKPFVCDVDNCGKAFRQRCVLKRHKSTHTGIKPFHCDVCFRGFIHAVYLKRHFCQPSKESKTGATTTTTSPESS